MSVVVYLKVVGWLKVGELYDSFYAVLLSSILRIIAAQE